VVIFTPFFLRQVKKFNKQSDKERCGLVIDAPLGFRIVELENTHEDPANHFAMTARNYKQLDPIMAIFHTHLEKEDDGPSNDDLQKMKALRMVLPRITGMVYVVPLGLLVEYTDKGPGRRLLIADT
jgi:proteasome lid subunit RPN8/RPN11